MKNAYFRSPVNLTGPVEIGIYETPVNLVLKVKFQINDFGIVLDKIRWSLLSMDEERKEKGGRILKVKLLKELEDVESELFEKESLWKLGLQRNDQDCSRLLTVKNLFSKNLIADWPRINVVRRKEHFLLLLAI